MPSSLPEDWRDRLHADLARDEHSADPSSRKPSEMFPSIPRYEISGPIGQGAAGVVYKAWDRELQRPVALKVLRPLVASTELARQRFRREAQAAAVLSHPNVVAAYDAGEHEGLLYIVMELVDGRPFSETLDAGKTSQPVLVRLLERAARGVGEAHAKGIVHRDLKPGNILVTASGEPKVADFGLAHLVDSSTELTRTGSTLGTPLYMSPEQVEGRGDEITPRTDVYALGAILYEILTGRPPHVGATPMEIYGRIVSTEPTQPRLLKPETPRDLQTIALKALEKEPGRRYPTAQAFAEDLRRHLEGEAVQAQSAGMTYRLYRRWRRNRLAWSLGFGAGLALLLAGVVSISANFELEKQVGLARNQFRVSQNAVLGLRSAGANDKMAASVPDIEATYRQALEVAPRVAEIDYLMGRLYRALLEDDKAEECQKRALEKDPEYAPALYEQAILLTARYGNGLEKAITEARVRPLGQGGEEATKEAETEDVAGGKSELVAIRERIRKDCAALQRVIASGRQSAGLRYVNEAHLKTVEGILAYHRKEVDEARRILEEVVQKNPSIEEAWEALGRAATRQGTLFEARATDREEILQKWEDVAKLWSKAISHDLGYVPHLLGRANASRSRALCIMKRGGDPLPDFRQAEADYSQVMKYTTKGYEAYHRRGNARDLMGVYLSSAGKDPTPEYEKAEEDFALGLARFGDRPELLQGRGLLRFHWTLYRFRQDEDPLRGYAAAEEDLKKALQLYPPEKRSFTHHTLSNVKFARGAHLKRIGLDPLPDFDGAETELVESLRLHPQAMYTWFALGQTRMERGLHRLDLGQNPLDDFTRAEKDFVQGLRLCADNSAFGLAQRGSIRKQLGRHYEGLKDFPKAVEKYAAAVSDFEKSIELRRNLDASQQKDFEEARRRLEVLQPK